MTLNIFSKITLLLGTAALVMACSGDGSEKAAADTVSSVKTQKADKKVEKRPYKMIEYKTTGQADADHLYLEEVLGEKALDEVKAWNKRSLDELKADSRYQTFYTAMERCIISGRMKPMCAVFGASLRWTPIFLTRPNGRPFSILIS